MPALPPAPSVVVVELEANHNPPPLVDGNVELNQHVGPAGPVPEVMAEPYQHAGPPADLVGLDQAAGPVADNAVPGHGPPADLVGLDQAAGPVADNVVPGAGPPADLVGLDQAAGPVADIALLPFEAVDDGFVEGDPHNLHMDLHAFNMPPSHWMNLAQYMLGSLKARTIARYVRLFAWR